MVPIAERDHSWRSVGILEDRDYAAFELEDIFRQIYDSYVHRLDDHECLCNAAEIESYQRQSDAGIAVACQGAGFRSRPSA